MSVETGMWREARERFEAAVRAHCGGLWLDPREWARLVSVGEAWEDLAESPVREAREEVAFLWYCAPDRERLYEASVRALGRLSRGEGSSYPGHSHPDVVS